MMAMITAMRKMITEIQRTDYIDKSRISTINKIAVIVLLNRRNHSTSGDV
jgi:hypothetical protein